jgi:hemerythrin
MAVMKNEKKHSLQKIDDEFKELIDELHHYTKNHFLYEERIMEKTQFPEMDAHKTIHHAFMKKISDIQHEADKKRDDKHKLLANMIVFIKGWYMEHVLIEDKKIVAHQKEIEAKAKPKA